MSEADPITVQISREIVLHPETERRRRRVAELRGELSTAFAERLHLSHELLPGLRDRYHEHFSDLERTLQLRTLEFAERRRIVELISLKLDRGQKLDEKSIDLVLKAVRAEFARVRARMHQRGGERPRRAVDPVWRPDEGEGSGDAGTEHPPAPPPRSRPDELRALYRRLARRLHPDVNPAGDVQSREYWDLVRSGYTASDLGLLRTLAHIVEMLGDAGEIPAQRLAIEERRLESALRTERAGIESITSTDIYVMRDSFDNPERIQEHRNRLQKEVGETEAKIAGCDRFLKTVLGGKKIPPPEVLKDIWANFVEEVYINSR